MANYDVTASTDLDTFLAANPGYSNTEKTGDKVYVSGGVAVIFTWPTGSTATEWHVNNIYLGDNAAGTAIQKGGSLDITNTDDVTLFLGGGTHNTSNGNIECEAECNVTVVGSSGHEVLVTSEGDTGGTKGWTLDRYNRANTGNLTLNYMIIERGQYGIMYNANWSSGEFSFNNIISRSVENYNSYFNGYPPNASSTITFSNVTSYTTRSFHMLGVWTGSTMTFDNFKSYAAGAGIIFDGYASCTITIQNSDFYGNGAQPIFLNSSSYDNVTITIDTCNFHPGAGVAYVKADDNSDIEFKNCEFHSTIYWSIGDIGSTYKIHDCDFYQSGNFDIVVNSETLEAYDCNFYGQTQVQAFKNVSLTGTYDIHDNNFYDCTYSYGVCRTHNTNPAEATSSLVYNNEFHNSGGVLFGTEQTINATSEFYNNKIRLNRVANSNISIDGNQDVATGPGYLSFACGSRDTRNFPYLAGDQDVTAPTWDSTTGIQTLTALSDSSLNASWNRATDTSTPVRYRIFIQAGTAHDLFEDRNILCDTQDTSFRIYTVGDGLTALASGVTYYVGVRALDAVGNVGTNTTSLSIAAI